MTHLITRKVNGTKIVLMGNAARNAFAIAIDGYMYGAGSDRMEALAAFKRICEAH